MIFSKLEYDGLYDDQHFELVDFISTEFKVLDSGLQGDSWIWIYTDNEKVALDTFSSYKHWVKCSTDGAHVKKVIDLLMKKYTVCILEEPELEPHE